jgi:hypothetical protein
VPFLGDLLMTTHTGVISHILGTWIDFRGLDYIGPLFYGLSTAHQKADTGSCYDELSNHNYLLVEFLKIKDNSIYKKRAFRALLLTSSFSGIKKALFACLN